MAQGYYLTKGLYDALLEMHRWWIGHRNRFDKYGRRRRGVSERGKIRIFEVQSNATGDGVYNCYEQTFDEDRWTDTTGADAFADKDSTAVEVLNLLEHHVHATYARNLIAGDRIAVWSFIDDENNLRLIGIPVGPYREGRTTLAKTQESAPGDANISVKICDQDGAVIGSAFDVACKISNGSALNAATPRLASGDYIFVTCIAGTWYCTTVFQGTENCTCTTP